MNKEKNINGNEVIDASKTEKKKMGKKKKIIILSIIGTLLVAGGIVLAISLLNRDNNDDNDYVYDNIMKEDLPKDEYQERVNALGEKAKQIVLDYYAANGKYPDHTYIENRINDENTECLVYNIYNDELKIDHCEFEGYYTNYDVRFLYKFEEIINKNSKENIKEENQNEKKTYNLDSFKVADLYGRRLLFDDMYELKSSSNERAMDDYSGYLYSFNDGKLIVKNNIYGGKVEFSNVSKAYYKGYECGEGLLLILYVKDEILIGIIPANYDELETLQFNKINSIKNDSISNVYSVYLYSTSCDAIIDYVAKKSDGTYINLENGKKYVLSKFVDYVYGYDNQSYDSKEFEKVMKVKATFNDALIVQTLFVIDENNYLYRVNEKTELIKEKNAKAVSLAKADSGGYNISFEDGSTFYCEAYLLNYNEK